MDRDRQVIDTFAALAVTAIALLPGGLYTWAYEQEVGASGRRRWPAG